MTNTGRYIRAVLWDMDGTLMNSQPLWDESFRRRCEQRGGSVTDEQVVSIRRAVAQGRAASVSGFISAAVARAQREDDLAQLLDDLDRELGPVDDADLAWAAKALGLA